MDRKSITAAATANDSGRAHFRPGDFHQTMFAAIGSPTRMVAQRRPSAIINPSQFFSQLPASRAFGNVPFHFDRPGRLKLVVGESGNGLVIRTRHGWTF